MKSKVSLAPLLRPQAPRGQPMCKLSGFSGGHVATVRKQAGAAAAPAQQRKPSDLSPVAEAIRVAQQRTGQSLLKFYGYR